MDYRQHDSLIKQQLRSLHHQAVRDLAWCCLSPPLITGLQELPLTHDNLWPLLYQLDKQPDVLVNLIKQRKSTRLGLYYETLWQFYFMQHPQWELLAYNQQIHHQNTTLGAFDFLCRRDNEYWHLETAVKFYLCAATDSEHASDWHQWIGPNKSDRLDIKLEHLRKHQMQLSQHPVAQQWLKDNFSHATNWKSALCLQGYFFQHDETQHPYLAHTEHCRGKWLTLDDFQRVQHKFASHYWLLLERHLWLSPAQTTDTEKLITTDNISALAMEQLQGKNRPLLVALMNNWGNLWQENARYFLVPNHWPQVASE